MEIKLTENIKIEMNLPIKKVESFQYSWKRRSIKAATSSCQMK